MILSRSITCSVRLYAQIFKTTRTKFSDSGQKLGDTFFDPQIQKILRKITNVEMDKVFKVRKLGGKPVEAEYKFMTDEELKEVRETAEKKAEKYLQMPPVIDERDDINEILIEDPYLDGHDEDHAKMIFTDISYETTDQDRLIVVREPNGVLRHAYWEERHRMNQIYFPRPGRQLAMPKMFQPELLQELLDKKEYIFILDRACAQFEPDDPEYHRVTHDTYDKINEEKDFDVLRSTRHFGPLAFYLVFNKNIDNLLLENIQTERLEDAVSLIHLYHIIHPDSKSSKETVNEVDLVKSFISLDSNKKNVLELALQSYLELQKQKKEIKDGIQRAHGH